MNKKMDSDVASPSPMLVDLDRANDTMSRHGIDLLVGSRDSNLYYLSGHAPDSVLNHFFDTWSAALLPHNQDPPPCLITSEYDVAYLATHPTWMPEVRLFGSEWSSAAGLLKKISDGQGVHTELRPRLAEIYQQSLSTREASLAKGIAAYLSQHFSGSPVTVGFDDMRLAEAVRQEFGAGLTVVDALWHFREIRLAKTTNEIALLKQAALINEAGVTAAMEGVAEGNRWSQMVDLYRLELARTGAKPSGERGMLFTAGPDGGFVMDHGYVESQHFSMGDAVILDAISSYRLYHADIARTAVIGEPNKKQSLIYDTLLEILVEAEDVAKAGVHTSDLTDRAVKTLEGRGLERALATLIFHPIGLRVFDYGSLEGTANGWSLESGTVLNFEVFYRDPDVGGIHVEDSIVISQTGNSRLGALDRALYVF